MVTLLGTYPTYGRGKSYPLKMVYVIVPWRICYFRVSLGNNLELQEVAGFLGQDLLFPPPGSQVQNFDDDKNRRPSKNPTSTPPPKTNKNHHGKTKKHAIAPKNSPPTSDFFSGGAMLVHQLLSCQACELSWEFSTAIPHHITQKLGL